MTPDLDLIGILTGPPWPEVPPPLRVVACGARGALYAPAHPAATARDAARAALTRATQYEAAGDPGRILPVAPGAAVPPGDVAAVLAAAEPEIARAASETGGGSEYHLRVTWAEDQVLSAFRGAPELAPVLEARRVRAGELADAVARLARRLAARMDDELAAAGLARVDQPRAPGMILHRALLVPPGAAGALDAALGRIDALWPEGLGLRLVGPMPPVSFALFDGVRIDAPRRAAARRLLGPLADAGIAAARRAALRHATGPDAVAAIRAAARDLGQGAWRLDRRPGAAVLPPAAAEHVA